ncbi:hypothetical protein PISL3812_08012 [Talaromyces islandicus]|uniref:Uncharacterized protein n=1 Tax=Talaromyces islandicus TaxID=28573 RepID=A0A0U1M5Z3_TALIS|nr:hypothetical protein PISL3812_08012 [Talaromyces islandicus]
MTFGTNTFHWHASNDLAAVYWLATEEAKAGSTGDQYAVLKLRNLALQQRAASLRLPGRLILLFYVKLERMVEDATGTSNQRLWYWNKLLAYIQKQPL